MKNKEWKIRLNNFNKLYKKDLIYLIGSLICLYNDGFIFYFMYKKYNLKMILL